VQLPRRKTESNNSVMAGGLLRTGTPRELGERRVGKGA